MRWIRYAALLGILTALVSASSADARPWPDTWDGIHIGLVFDYKVRAAPSKGQGVDVVFGADQPRGPFRSVNSRYVPFDRELVIHPIRWWRKHHPTWVVYRCDRRTPARQFGDRNIPIDITNPAVRRFQWEQEVRPALALGYPAIAFDNLMLSNYAGRCGHYNSRRAWVRQYSGAPSEPRYRRAVINWARHFRRRIHSYPSHPTMWINFSYEQWEPAADNARLASAADLVMDERGVTNWGQTGRQWPAPADWLAIFRSTRALEAAGRCYLMNGQEPERGRNIPRSARLWNIANYLLLKERCTYMHISGVQEYGRLLAYPEYRLPVGHPTGAPAEQGGVWQRTYSNGLVLVNPADTRATVPLDGSYTDDRGKTVTSPIALGPHSAAILVPVALAGSPR